MTPVIFKGSPMVYMYMSDNILDLLIVKTRIKVLSIIQPSLQHAHVRVHAHKYVCAYAFDTLNKRRRETLIKSFSAGNYILNRFTVFSKFSSDVVKSLNLKGFFGGRAIRCGRKKCIFKLLKIVHSSFIKLRGKIIVII